MPRFIPACTGNASALSPSWPASSVHPRMCGERFLRLRIMCRYVGSSPHVRGTHGVELTPSVVIRFIPACAGNARWPKLPEPDSAVHPRMRGERQKILDERTGESGSSPHARGTHSGVFGLGVNARFIPACTGNARQALPAQGRNAVHPRMRGERLPTLPYEAEPIGSSPHARGTPSHSARSHPAARFIPAYAGNALGNSLNTARETVHPRIRGERGRQHGGGVMRDGSSPHTRGTRCTCVALPRYTRFIPAYAGNAQASRSAPDSRPVHPRIRGERWVFTIFRRCLVGSSPHTRGTHEGHLRSGISIRFIPAYAGNARVSWR